MYRTLLRNTTFALGALVLSSSLVFAAGMPGSVTALDGKGMATVRTSDSKEHQVKAGEGFKVGMKVECEAKNNVLECRATDRQAAAPTTSSTVTPAKAATAPAPAPAVPMTTSNSAAPAASTAAPAPSAK
jgi:hypothetical protein